MAQMELDYAQFVVEDNPDDIRCVLTTDAKSAFQSARETTATKFCALKTRCENVSPHSLCMHIRDLSESFDQQHI